MFRRFVFATALVLASGTAAICQEDIPEPRDMSQPSTSAPQADGRVPTAPPSYTVPETNGRISVSPAPSLGGNTAPPMGGSVNVRFPPAPPPTTGHCSSNGVPHPC